jgi:methionyl-tRNA formyltransferase
MARLAFFGTPRFALPSLKSVHRFCCDFGHTLVLVVTQVDKAQGRGQRLLPPPVKELARALGVEIAQPLTLKKNTEDGDAFYERFLALNIDMAIVVAYGKIISDRLLKVPRFGFLNVHGSLLPRFRGAAPIQRAIEAGDRKTGVCLMDIVKGLDEGDIYASSTTPILASDTSDTLFRRLSHLGAALLSEHLAAILAGEIHKKPQADEGVIYAPMLSKDEGGLNFLIDGNILSHKVRAFDPWPTAYGFIRGKRIKFFDSFFIKNFSVHKHILPGTVVAIGEFLGVKTVDGIIYFSTLQVEGKKILPVKEVVLGFSISVGDQISIK